MTKPRIVGKLRTMRVGFFFFNCIFPLAFQKTYRRLKATLRCVYHKDDELEGTGR